MRNSLIFTAAVALSAAANAWAGFSTDWEALIASKGPYVLQASWAGSTPAAELGASMAMWHDSATDADWMIAGAPVENMFKGAAYIYRRAPGDFNWTFDARLSAPDESTDSEFGFAVAIDNGTVVVTAPLHVNAFVTGAAYVFVRDPATGKWNQQGSEFNGLTSFGVATALRGNTMVVSDPGADKVHVYGRVSDTWSEIASIATPSGISANANFGASLWTDGDTLLVGAPNDSSVGSKQGSVAVYLLSGDTRTPYQIIRPEIDTSADQAFGASAVLSTHGILIGSPHSNSGAGAVNSYLFDPTTSAWAQQMKLTDTTNSPASPVPGLGQSLATSSNLLVAGDPRRDRATVYTYDAGTWARDSILNGNAASLFGYAVATANGTVGVGALLDGSASQGSASLFISDRIFSDDIEIE